MLTDDEELFQGTAQEAEDEKERTGISKYAGRKSLIEEPVKGRLFCMKKATETKSVAFVISFFRVIGQNVLMANPSHQTFYPHYVSRSKQLHHPRLKDSFPIDSSHSFADK